jgi:septal ring factor EnvC (AmiA/AmiB activator)
MASRCSDPSRTWSSTIVRVVVPSVAAMTAALLSAVIVTAQQGDRARTEAMARRAGDRLVALQREADRLAADETTLLNDLRKLEIDRQIKAEQLKQADGEVARIQAEIDSTAKAVTALEATEASERPRLESRLVEMYKLGKARYARMLLATPDLRRLGQASRTVAALAAIDHRRIADHERTIAGLHATRATLDARRRDAAAARASAERVQAAAARATQAQADLIRDVDRRRDLTAQFAGELQAAQLRLQAALRDNASPMGDAGLPLKPFRGDLDWPSTGQLRARFGRPAGTPGATFSGIELADDSGAPVRAIHDGLVAYAGSFAGFGNLVILDHGSQSFSLYGDLLEIGVTKGARVDRGQPVGSAGPLPSGGTGMYFELRIDGRPVDPIQWLRKR